MTKIEMSKIQIMTLATLYFPYSQSDLCALLP